MAAGDARAPAPPGPVVGPEGAPGPGDGAGRHATTWTGGWPQGLSYGGLGLPLAFVALPLYVILPNHYADAFGVPLATLGALLLGARLLDAFADPLIGRLADRWLDGPISRVLRAAILAAVVLAIGFHALFFPAVRGLPALLWWCGIGLAVTYLAYSVLSVLHQAWGARLGGDEAQRARIVAWREALALVGVLVASVLPSVAGLGATAGAFAGLLAIGVIGLWRAPRPPLARPLPDAAPHAGSRTATPSPAIATSAPGALSQPWRVADFRRLLLVFLVNGIATAVPATLVLFFIRDRLQAQAWEPLFLASYFAAGALSMPLWVRLVGRWGLAGAWRAGMVLAVLTFAWAATLGSGDVSGYIWVCLASGLALGADLALPGALLTGVIQRAGHAGRLEGAYFGWWNFATKLNLALAAGIALPLLGLFGYAPGARDPQALQALTVVYCLLPCALKLLAAGLLHTLWIRGENR
jgi:GPH family glycoside/pentoside/hexuronide:cation symporter